MKTLKDTATIAGILPFLAVWGVVAPAYLWTIRGVLKVTGLDR
jgi:hypothetical protein